MFFAFELLRQTDRQSDSQIVRQTDRLTITSQNQFAANEHLVLSICHWWARLLHYCITSFLCLTKWLWHLSSKSHRRMSWKPHNTTISQTSDNLSNHPARSTFQTVYSHDTSTASKWLSVPSIHQSLLTLCILETSSL